MSAAAYNRGSKLILDSIKTPEHNRSLPGSVSHPYAADRDEIAKPEPLRVGETVYCTVRAQRGQPHKITAIKGDRIKIAGYGPWCPAYNFQREPT